MKIQIKDKILFVQIEKKRMERKDEKRVGTTETIVLRGSVSAPRQREFVQLSELTAIFNRTKLPRRIRPAGRFQLTSTCLRYFSELCIALQQRNLDRCQAQ